MEAGSGLQGIGCALRGHRSRHWHQGRRSPIARLRQLGIDFCPGASCGRWWLLQKPFQGGDLGDRRLAGSKSLLDGSDAGTEHMIKEVGHLKQLADEEFAARGLFGLGAAPAPNPRFYYAHVKGTNTLVSTTSRISTGYCWTRSRGRVRPRRCPSGRRGHQRACRVGRSPRVGSAGPWSRSVQINRLARCVVRPPWYEFVPFYIATTVATTWRRGRNWWKWRKSG